MEITRKRSLFNSLTFKISFFVTFVMLSALAVFSIVFILSEQKETTEVIIKNGESFANYSAREIYDNYTQYYTHPRPEDFENFKANVELILKNNTDVTRVSLVSINGQVLFDSGEFLTGKYAGEARIIQDPETLTLINENQISSREVYENGERVMEIFVPLQQVDGHVFSMRYFLSFRSFWDRMRSVYYNIVSVVTPLTAFIIILAIPFSIALIRPLKALTGAMEQVRAGNLRVRADISSGDEIGDLASGFNEMAAHLEVHNAEMEAKIIEIQERTKELKEEQARFLASIYSLPLGFILADRDHRLILKNNSVNSALDVPEGDLALQQISDALAGVLDLKGCAEDCMRGKRPMAQEIEFAHKFLKFLFGPVILEDSGEVIGYIALIEDTTEAKLLERTRDEFFLIASHELRTPLTAIKGNAELIREFFSKEIQNKEVSSMISDIEEASARLITITNDFLDLSRIEQHKIEIKKERVDIPSVAQEVVHSLHSIAIEKKLDLRLEPQPNLPEVWGDRDRIKQILVNLVGNAVNYTHQGSVVISIGLVSRNAVRVSVADTGIGIAPENQRFLFKKFQQAGTTIYTRDVTKGTGLGLYISKLLTESMNGDIRLEESVPGKGSIFSLTLPAAV